MSVPPILFNVIFLISLANLFSVRPHNTGALFAVYAIIGISSVSLLPVGLELGCELTRNADGSSAVLWFL